VAIGHGITGERRAASDGAGWDHVHVCGDDCSRLAYVEGRGGRADRRPGG
jgi:hypothetical protein